MLYILLYVQPGVLSCAGTGVASTKKAEIRASKANDIYVLKNTKTIKQQERVDS